MTASPPTRGRLGRTIAACGALGLLATLTIGAGPAAAVAPTEATVPVVIVLDASGSMNQNDAPGVRMDAAKNAVTSLISSLPPQSTVGLMVYGTQTGSTDAEKDAGCRDISTLTPVGPLDAAAMTAQVATVQASGYTPIGNALRAAADALPNEGPRSIVLVSDGEDTCAPPTPCDIAADLDRQGVDLTVHTVGFKVDEAARQQLSCIAEATGGTFADASDAAQLEQALQVKVDYAITGYTAQGTPVVGADQPSEQAPLLVPGQYTDTYAVGEVDAGDAGPGRNGTTKYYTIPVRDGFRPYVSATLIPPQDVGKDELGIEAVGVELTLLAKDSTECASARDFVVNSTDRLRPVTTVMSGPTVGGPSYPRKCNTEDVQILQVERFGSTLTDLAMTMELVIRMEPPADASGVPAAVADTSPALPTPVHGTPTPISGGSSFNDATDLISGSTYADSLATGQSRYYKFPVQWGQRFSYTVSPAGTAAPVTDLYGTITWVDTFNPVREEVDVTGSDNGEVWYKNQPGNPFTGSSTVPARYTNRDSGSGRDYALDGFYYLRIDTDLANEQSTVPFLITVVVSGEVEPGPVYQPAGGGASSGSASLASSTSSSTSSSASTSLASSSGSVPPSSSGSASSTGSGATDPSTSNSADSTSDSAVALTANGQSDSSGGATWWIVGGSVALVLIAVAIWWTTRRRTPTPPASHW